MIGEAITRHRTLPALAIACSLAAFAVQPAAAQTASNLKCNGCIKSKQIKDNKLKSKDIKDGQLTGADMSANVSLGTGSDDGDLSVKDTGGTETVSLDGATGDVTNSLTGNGLVKAWASINPDGTIRSCWRCNLDPAATQRVAPGTYVVDFLPLATDIGARPRLAVIDDPAPAGFPLGIVSLLSIPTPLSSVAVLVTNNPPTAFTDLPFTVVIY